MDEAEAMTSSAPRTAARPGAIWRRRIATAVNLVIVAMALGTVVFFVLGGGRAPSGWGTGAIELVQCVPTLAFAAVGLLIVRRQPWNAVGWICLGTGLSLALVCFSVTYALYVVEANPRALPGGATAAWLGNWGYVPAVGLFGALLPLVFPTGRLLSRRWRWAFGLGVVVIIASSTSNAIFPGPLQYSVVSVSNPYGVDGAESLDGTFALLLPCMLLAAISVVMRLRRSAGIEREQLKVFAVTTVLFSMAFVGEVFVAKVMEADRYSGLLEDVLSVGFATLPVAIGVAMLRHRLYDVDVVINRALVYGGLTATLAAAYLISVLLLQLALSPFTQGSSFAIAVSTLTVAALAKPARARIQERVDRRFFRRRYDAGQTLERFTAHMRSQVHLGDIGSELLAVVNETMQPRHAMLWLPNRRDG
jgi:hypothetical protein